MRLLRWSLVFAACVGTGCRAQPALQDDSGNALGPTATRNLVDFGAVGDGRTDDTIALKRALEGSSNYCIDGGGRTFRVIGTLRAAHDLCLRNVTLLQAAVPVDTTRFIRNRCPAVRDPNSIIDCGDLAVPDSEFGQLWDSLSVRTLLIRPGGNEPIRVVLENVKIDRGRYAEGGSRSDSAGIWLDGANGVELRNVEITGDGKGYGLFITNSANVSVSGLWIHDLTWAPYRGEAPLSKMRVRSVGWNAAVLHEFREKGRDGATEAKFYGVRVQEQLTCVNLSNVSRVRIDNVRIERCLAQFEDGKIPWQTDGLDIGRSSSDITIRRVRIDSTWEGMDIAAGGTGIQDLILNDITVTNSFSFGLKMGYQLEKARVSKLAVNGAGLSGIVVYGPVRNVSVSSASITRVGLVRNGATDFAPWPAGNRAGVRIDGTPESSPADVLFEDVTVSGNPNEYEFGILNTGGQRIRTARFTVQGAGSERARGIDLP